MSICGHGEQLMPGQKTKMFAIRQPPDITYRTIADEIAINPNMTDFLHPPCDRITYPKAFDSS